MKAFFPYTQIRIARPTDQISKVVEFYTVGLGLREIARFQDHDGFSGVMLGLPDATYHLEFTQHQHGSPCPAPTKDNLLVFYMPDTALRDEIAQRLFQMGYPEVEPENPYWKLHGVTIEDPDKWRVVLMDVAGFRIE
jgi:catechol 2,3-dioxygenase-like lactoylglutathione lyase family enzyme